MKKLTLSWDGVNDTTGYLFSFAKALSCVLKYSPLNDLSEDIIASSGFAFRMWINPELCPSATSVWEFKKQPVWLASGGIDTTYAECLFQPEDVAENSRLAVLPAIRQSIDRGMAVISWDIGVLEWGLITGYDDNAKKFSTLCINGTTDDMDYEQLGKREMPMLNVVTITGRNERSQTEIISDTLKIAKAHLSGEEWCDNIAGLKVYSQLIKFFQMEDEKYAACWGMEYALGTYAALKWYAWKFFEKYGMKELAELYKTVYECWQNAFLLKKTTDMKIKENRDAVIVLLNQAEGCEQKAVTLM